MDPSDRLAEAEKQVKLVKEQTDFRPLQTSLNAALWELHLSQETLAEMDDTDHGHTGGNE